MYIYVYISIYRVNPSAAPAAQETIIYIIHIYIYIDVCV